MEIPLDLRLAVRNVFRNKVRSLITLAAIAFGCISLIVAGGFFEDTFLQMREGVIHSHLGHIQVYKKGYLEKGSARPFDYMIKNPDEIKKLISSIEHVKFVTPRIAFSGLMSTGENTVSVIGQGVNPEGEQAISVIETVKGANTGVAIEAGENLSQSDMYDVILGRGLAKAMGSNVGDFIILVSNTVGGALNAMDMKVKGIFFTASKEFDDRAVRMPIAVAQTLLRTGEVQTLVVLVDKTENTDRVKKQLLYLVKNKGLDLELKPWYECGFEYLQYNKYVNMGKNKRNRHDYGFRLQTTGSSKTIFVGRACSWHYRRFNRCCSRDRSCILDFPCWNSDATTSGSYCRMDSTHKDCAPTPYCFFFNSPDFIICFFILSRS
jgi:putative ABC transport system permease protein